MEQKMGDAIEETENTLSEKPNYQHSSGDLDDSLVETVHNFTGPPGYRCKECNVFYPRKWHMKLHIRIHTGEKPYICDHQGCNKAFSRPGTLSEHKRRNHDKVFQHVCPICDKKFYGRSDMLTHIVIHDEARQTRERFLPPQMMNLLNEVEEFNFDGQMIISNCVCDQCGKIFDKKGGKERHVKNVHSRQYKCLANSIPVINGSSTDLKYENIKVEIDPAGIKCEPYDIPNPEEAYDLKKEDIKKENIFTNEDIMKQEEYISKSKITNLSDNVYQSPPKELLFPCDLCENALSTKESLDIHKLIHAELNRFTCKEKDCSDIFPNHKSLNRHLKVIHKIEKKNDNRMFHMCQDCGKQCTTKAGLQDHMLSHSKEKNFVCLECGKMLKRRDSLAQHMRIHTGEMKYHCDQCEARYVSSAALRNHTLSKHTEETNAVKFICSYCGKDFKKKDYLIKHVTGHTGEKKYQCNVCEKSFRFETSLASHMDMHNGIKKFQCPHCDKRFTQRQQMNVHVRRHTGDKRHKCDMCSEAFIEPRCLRNHIKRHHE